MSSLSKEQKSLPTSIGSVEMFPHNKDCDLSISPVNSKSSLESTELLATLDNILSNI